MGGASRQAVFMSVSIRACMGDVVAMGGACMSGVSVASRCAAQRQMSKSCGVCWSKGDM